MNECVPTDHISVTQEVGGPVNTKVTLATGGHLKHRNKATPPSPCLCLGISKETQVSLQERRTLRGGTGGELN